MDEKTEIFNKPKDEIMDNAILHERQLHEAFRFAKEDNQKAFRTAMFAAIVASFAFAGVVFLAAIVLKF